MPDPLIELQRRVADAIAHGADPEMEAIAATQSAGVGIEYRVVQPLGSVHVALPATFSTLALARKAREVEARYLDTLRNQPPEWRRGMIAALHIEARLIAPWTPLEEP